MTRVVLGNSIALLECACVAFVACMLGGCTYLDTFPGDVLRETRVSESRELGPLELSSATWSDNRTGIRLQLSRPMTTTIIVKRERQRVRVMGQLVDQKYGVFFNSADGPGKSETELKMRAMMWTIVLAWPVILPVEIKNSIEYDKEWKRALAEIRNGAREALVTRRIFDGRIETYKFFRVLDGTMSKTEKYTQDEGLLPASGLSVRLTAACDATQGVESVTDEQGQAYLSLSDLPCWAENVESRTLIVLVKPAATKGRWAELSRLNVNELDKE